FTDWIGCECSASAGHCMKCLEGSLDWIILGGESASTKAAARPCDVAHLRYGVVQCQQAGVACFLKQYGSNPVSGSRALSLFDPKGGDPAEWDESVRVRQFPEVAYEGIGAMA